MNGDDKETDYVYYPSESEKKELLKLIIEFDIQGLLDLADKEGISVKFHGNDTIQITDIEEKVHLEMSARKIDSLIAACEHKVRLSPHDYPAHDYPWSIKEVDCIDNLIDAFAHGNWSVRTGFILDNLAFVEQVSGGNEWLALMLDGGEWKSFDSISFYHILKKHGADYCETFIETIQNTSWHELQFPSMPEGPDMQM